MTCSCDTGPRRGPTRPGPAGIGGLTLAGLALLLLAPSDAWAYVDPGTGSYLFQLAVAGLVAGAYTIRRYWDGIKRLFRGRSTPSPGGADAPPDRPHGMD
jgi:hypothetical protein